MSPQEEAEIINYWNEFHSVGMISDMLKIPSSEVKDVLSQAKGQTLYPE